MHDDADCEYNSIAARLFIRADEKTALAFEPVLLYMSESQETNAIVVFGLSNGVLLVSYSVSTEI